MRFKYQIIGMLLIIQLVGCTTNHSKGYSEQEAQSVITNKFGISTTVLKPKGALRDTPLTGVNGFPFLLKGNPSISVVLDRDYWVIASTKENTDLITYMLNPIDEQSSLLISIGKDLHEQSDADIVEQYKPTKIKKQSGVIANNTVSWRQWSDENHLYSDCYFDLPAMNDIVNKKYNVIISIIANTTARRKALEDHMASIQLLFIKSAKKY